MSWAAWITGLPGSGKSAVARAAAAALAAQGQRVAVLELDEIRRVLTPSPVYSDAERELVYRSLVFMARVLAEAGMPVIIDATGHRRQWRDLARASIPTFVEVQLECPLAICQEREQRRQGGHAPAGIYARAGRPGATVPGVDVAYEPALMPELLIDTTVETVEGAARRVATLVHTLSPVAGVAPRRRAWAIWITGLPGSGKSTVAGRVGETLAARHLPVRVLTWEEVVDTVLGRACISELEQDVLHRALACTTWLLTEAGGRVLVDATGPRRVWRDLARSLVAHFAEVQLVCPAAICAAREQRVRWAALPCPQAGHRASAPEVVVGYEPARAPEVTVHTDLGGSCAAVDEVVRLAYRLERRAGRLGDAEPIVNPERRTPMRVRDIMTNIPVTVDPATPVLDARQRMVDRRIRHLLVCEGSRLVGIVTDRDIRLNLPSPATSLSVWEINYLLARLSVGEVMSKSVIVVDPDRDAPAAARIMLDHKIGALPVLEGDRLVGIVTETDFLRAFASLTDRPVAALAVAP